MNLKNQYTAYMDNLLHREKLIAEIVSFLKDNNYVFDGNLFLLDEEGADYTLSLDIHAINFHSNKLSGYLQNKSFFCRLSISSIREFLLFYNESFEILDRMEREAKRRANEFGFSFRNNEMHSLIVYRYNSDQGHRYGNKSVCVIIDDAFYCLSKYPSSDEFLPFSLFTGNLENTKIFPDKCIDEMGNIFAIKDYFKPEDK